MNDKDIYNFLRKYTVIGDSHATTMAAHNLISPNSHYIYTMYSLYNNIELEWLKIKLSDVKHLIIFMGINDIILNLPEPIETVFYKYFDYLYRLKEDFKLEELAVITPTSVAKNIEVIRSDFDTTTLIRRLKLLEIEVMNHLNAPFTIIPSSHVVADSEGFTREIYRASDGVHLNQDGYRLWALEIVKKLKEIDHG